MKTAAPTTLSVAIDPRVQAFCSGASPDVFSGIVYQPQIWSADPFDVMTVHETAREVFQRLLFQANGDNSLASGKILLLLGEGGSGKTHLMRAFRDFAHQTKDGYFGYLQMTTQVTNYTRYVLGRLLESLDHPYSDPLIPTSGMNRLATGLIESVPGVTAAEIERFREGDRTEIHEWVERYSNGLLQAGFDPNALDLYRAILYLNLEDPLVKSRVLKWLRCEDLTPTDRDYIGGLVPRTQQEDPLRTIEQLGLLIGKVHQAALVLCVDQIEDVFNQDNPAERFQKVIDTLVAIADHIPNAIVVLSCLEDYFSAHQQSLSRTKLDRLLRNPDAIRLEASRSQEEINAIASRRLECLYQEFGATWKEEEPVFPFREEHLLKLLGLRTRDIIGMIRKHRDRCVAAGQWLEPEDWDKKPVVTEDSQKPVKPEPPVLPDDNTVNLDQAWNDYRATAPNGVPDEETELAAILAASIEFCSLEWPDEIHFAVDRKDRVIPTEVHLPDNEVRQLFVALCEKRAQGGGLAKQITELEKTRGEFPAVVVRSTAYPGATAAVSKQITALIKGGGNKVQVENSDWRIMSAFAKFAKQRKDEAGFGDWMQRSRPLGQLASLQRILNLEEIAQIATSLSNKPKPTAAGINGTAAAASTASARPTGRLLVGNTRSTLKQSVDISPEDLKCHMAFIGGSGSGKTTAVLNLIEQLVQQGIPAILVDRKGDLCRYADPEAWLEPSEGRSEAEKTLLHNQLDVALYTPGDLTGRSLSLPIVPAGMEQLNTSDRDRVANTIAAALGSMMRFTRGSTHKQAILKVAIEVCSRSARTAGVPELIDMIARGDDDLINAVSGYNDRHFRSLHEDLLSLWNTRQQLLAPDQETIDIDALFGTGAFAVPNKTRLSILSTKSLGDDASVQFWVSQFLMSLERWIGKNPQPSLSGVVLFDEADRYLPAQSNPPTKGPMESLLRRARSAGIGILLASQNPGDFDYKCRDNIKSWLIGRVREDNSIRKIRSMLGNQQAAIADRLASQEAGEFYLVQENTATSVKTQRSLLSTSQVPEDRILELASSSSGSATIPS